MKTKSIFVLAAIIAITSGSLQKTNAQAWSINGNAGTNPPTHFLGTTDNKSLVFKTQGQRRMVIGQGGNVGIGIFENIGFPLNFASTTGDKISLSGNSGAHYGFGIQNNLLQIHSMASTADIAFGYGSSAAFTERMRIKGNGNVGIGTASPAVKLYITGGSDAGLSGGFIITGDLASANMGIDNNEIQTRSGGIASTLYLNNDGGDINLRADAMHITNGKLVGIGTATPTSKLHVVGTSFFNGKVGIGTNAPAVTLHVATGDDSKPESGGFIVTGTTTLENISIDQNEIMARNNGKVSTLYLNHSGGNVVIDGTNTGSKVGIGTATPDFQLQLSKNSAAKPGSSFWTVASPVGLEKNIAEFTDGLNIINQIHPVSYSYDGGTGTTSNERFVGTLGRELQKVAPYMVKESTSRNEENGLTTNYLNVDYNALLFMFVNAFKEQQKEINSQNTKIEELTKLVDQLVQSRSVTKDNATASNLSSINAVLEQNAPNPFNSSTTIRYHVPASVSNAQIMITNGAGNLIKSFNLINKGAGSVTIKAGELAAGNYYYTLVVDGKKVDSKQMILIK